MLKILINLFISLIPSAVMKTSTIKNEQASEDEKLLQEFERQEKERLQVKFIFLDALKIIIKALGVSCLCLLSILSKIGGGGRTEGEAETAEVA